MVPAIEPLVQTFTLRDRRQSLPGLARTDLSRSRGGVLWRDARLTLSVLQCGFISVIESRLRVKWFVSAGGSGAASTASAVRKARASMARVMCGCQEVQCLTW